MDHDQADALNGAIRVLAIDHRALAAHALEPLGLHPGQEGVLFTLERYGPQTQAGLAHRLGCEPPSITGMVRKLEEAGLVQRDPEVRDRRVRNVSLTDRGRELMPTLWRAWRALADQSTAQLPAQADIAAAIQTLQAIASSVNHARHANRPQATDRRPPP